MKIVKKIARFILRSELAKMRRTNASLSFQVEELSTQYDKVNRHLEEIQRQRNELSQRFEMRPKIMINEHMLQRLSYLLPDPNRVALRYQTLTAEVLQSDYSTKYTEYVKGQGYNIQMKICRLVKNPMDENEVSGVEVFISCYDMKIIIPLRKEKKTYRILGVETEIETYFYDFYESGLRLLTGSSWNFMAEFMRAQFDMFTGGVVK
jgi:hypothetical protein|nr:MAG TPA: hypothetical protein [Caudoviricetes sp.]